MSSEASKCVALLQQCTTEFNTEDNTGIGEQVGVVTLKNRQDLNTVGEERYRFQLKISG